MSHPSDFEETRAYLETAVWPQKVSSWYYAGNRREFATGLRPLELVGHALMLFTDERGDIKAMQRNCLHMNVDLSRGTREKGIIRCAMHGWKYQLDGTCVNAPNAGKLRSYPVHVWLDQVFVFLGEEEHFFPFPQYVHVEEALAMSAQSIRLETATPWYLMAGNGFDLHHFLTVHSRRIINQPEISSSSPKRLSTRLVLENVGTHVFDRLLRRFFGQRIELHYEVVGGNMVLATSLFGKKPNYMFFCIHPSVSGKLSELHLLFLKKKGALKLFDSISLFFRKILIHRFFQAELDNIRELKLTPSKLIPKDFFLMRFLKNVHLMISNPASPSAPIELDLCHSQVREGEKPQFLQ